MKSNKNKFNQLFKKIHQQMLMQRGLLEQNYKHKEEQQIPQSYERAKKEWRIIDPFLKKLEKSHRRSGSAVSYQHKRQSSIPSQMYKKIKTKAEQQLEAMLKTFSKYIYDYMNKLAEQQRKKVNVQINKIIATVSNCRNFNTIGNKLKAFQQRASKQLSHRLPQLVFCIIQSLYHRHSQTSSLDQKIEKLIVCEYYCRKMNFDQLTVKICFDIHKFYILSRKFKESRIYAKKVLKLAVILRDKDLEFNIIQQISLLNFYQGKINHRTQDFLRQEQRINIQRNYNEDNQMPPIFVPNNMRIQLLKKRSQFCFQFQKQNNYVSNEIPKINKQSFAQNFNSISRNCQINKFRLMKTMGKVADVGCVNKYIGEKNFITLMSETHQIPQTNQLQVNITHTKRNMKINPFKFINEELPLFIKAVQDATFRPNTTSSAQQEYLSLARNLNLLNLQKKKTNFTFSAESQDTSQKQ